MDNSNNIQSVELEQLRTQYELLKQQISQHSNLREEQIRTSMKSNQERTHKILKYCSIILMIIVVIDAISLIVNPHSVHTKAYCFNIIVFVPVILLYLQSIRKNKHILCKMESSTIEALEENIGLYKTKNKWWEVLSIAIILAICSLLLMDLLSSSIYFFVAVIVSCIVLITIVYYLRKKRYNKLIQEYKELVDLEEMKGQKGSNI